jgi:hypothetical protein
MKLPKKSAVIELLAEINLELSWYLLGEYKNGY